MKEFLIVLLRLGVSRAAEEYILDFLFCPQYESDDYCCEIGAPCEVCETETWY